MCINNMSLYSFFFKQNTAYEMRISDWSSDLCSSDLLIMRSESITSRHSPRSAPRIALGGFMLESNGNAPVSTRKEFEANVLLEGQALLKDMEARNPRSPTPLTGFAAAMDRT